MNPRNLAVLLTSLLLGAAVAACGAAAGTGDDGGAGVGAECGGNGDCSGNLQCLASERVCVETCAPGGSDCGGDACIPLNDTVGYCDFSAAVNNGGGQDGFCLQPCAATADCPAGQTCVDVTGQGNMECVEGQNVPADAPSCNGTTPCPEGWDGCFVQGK